MDETRRKKSLCLLELLSKFPQSGFGFGRGPWGNNYFGSGLVVVLLLTTGSELKILRRHFFNRVNKIFVVMQTSVRFSNIIMLPRFQFLVESEWGPRMANEEKTEQVVHK